MSVESESTELLGLTSSIVASHVSKNNVPVGDLSELINQVYRALASLGKPTAIVTDKREPAVPVKKSVFPDYIVCLEDGKRLKMLKRHLQNAYGLTPEQYRERWNLPADYPMVCPNYARTRSTLAKKSGLGNRFRGGAKAES